MAGLSTGALVGIFGGTFDPPHLGHLILAEEARVQLGLERLLWMLTPDPPPKQGHDISPLSARLEMLRAALAGNPAFEISTIEIDRPGPQFAVDTARLVAAAYPGCQVVYLVGGDSLRDLPKWRDPRGLVAALDGLAVMRRPGVRLDLDALEAAVPGIGAKLRFVDAPLIDISSTLVRRRAREGGTYRYFVPPAVAEIIARRGLYAA
jgi:nicotinate-nucleotide adenylyltransferase